MPMTPLTEEQLARVEDFLAQTPKAKKKKSAVAPVTPEAPIEDPFLRGVVEGVSNAADSIANRPSPALIAALQSTGRQGAVEPSQIELEAPEPSPRKQALNLIASVGGSIPMRSDAEMEAMRELRATQEQGQRAQALIPFMLAGQKITEAFTGAPSDVQGIGAIQSQIAGRTSDAAQRLQAAQDFARRQQQGQQFEASLKQRADESNLEYELRLAQAAAQAAAQARLKAQDERKVALAEEMARQRAVQQARGVVGRAQKPPDELTQRKRELEIKKLEAELAAMQGGQPTTEQQIKALQLQQLQQRVTGQDPTKVKMAESSAQRMKNLISELRTLYKQHGPKAIGPIANRMAQISEAITLEAKNIGELGALSGPDKGILENIKGTEPTAFFANTFGTGDTLQSLDFMQKWVDSSVQAARDVYGPEKAKPKGIPGFPFVVVDKQTGREFTIKSREELDKVRPYADRLQMKGAQ